MPIALMRASLPRYTADASSLAKPKARRRYRSPVRVVVKKWRIDGVCEPLPCWLRVRCVPCRGRRGCLIYSAASPESRTRDMASPKRCGRRACLRARQLVLMTDERTGHRSTLGGHSEPKSPPPGSAHGNGYSDASSESFQQRNFIFDGLNQELRTPFREVMLVTRNDVLWLLAQPSEAPVFVAHRIPR